MNHRLLLADNHELFLKGLLALLEKEEGLEVVGEAKDGREAFHKARELKPDLVILDISMPGLNGIEATRQITEELGLKTLCLSMYTETRYVTSVLEAGASGYLVKNCELAELLRAVRVVLSGQTYLSPAIAGTLVDWFRKSQGGQQPPVAMLLTEREREVLQLVAEGYSGREIALQLCISPKTVHTHRKNLEDKLHIRSVAGLTKYAVQEGITSGDPNRTSGF